MKRELGYYWVKLAPFTWHYGTVDDGGWRLMYWDSRCFNGDGIGFTEEYTHILKIHEQQILPPEM